jgi:hypothetical protein
MTGAAAAVRRNRGDSVATLAAALAAAGLTFARSGRAQMWPADMGLLFGIPQRILSGEVAYRDFDLYSTPLTFYTHALGLKLFGFSMLFERLYISAECALLVGLAYWFCRRALGLGAAKSAAIAAFQTIWAPQMMLGAMWYDGDVTLVVFVAGLCLYRAWNGRSERSALWCAACGALCAISFWYKQDIGAGALAAAGVLAWARAREDRRRLQDALALSAAAALATGAVLLYFFAHDALPRTFYWVATRALMNKWGPSSNGQSSFKLLSPFTTKVDRSSRVVVLLYAAAPLACWLRWRRVREPCELALAAATLLWFSSFYAGLFTHNGQAYSARVATLGPVLAVLGRPWEWGPLLRHRRAVVLAWLVVVVGMGALGLRYLRHMTRDASSLRLRSARLAGMWVPPSARALDGLAEYIERRVPPQDEILDLDSIIIYYLTSRRAPHPFADFSYGEVIRSEDEDRLLARLNAADVRWYFHLGDRRDCERDPLWSLSGLKAYLAKNFRFKEAGDGFTVWEARPR